MATSLAPPVRTKLLHARSRSEHAPSESLRSPTGRPDGFLVGTSRSRWRCPSTVRRGSAPPGPGPDCRSSGFGRGMSSAGDLHWFPFLGLRGSPLGAIGAARLSSALQQGPNLSSWRSRGGRGGSDRAITASRQGRGRVPTRLNRPHNVWRPRRPKAAVPASHAACNVR
jgi:hypothetical protein